MPVFIPVAVRPALRWLAVAGAYYGLARFSTAVGFIYDGVPLVVFAQGVAFAAVQRWGPWMATSVAAAAALEGLIRGVPIGSVVLLACAAAAAGLVAYAVTPPARRRPTGERITDTLTRTGAATAGGIAGGTFGIAAAIAGGGVPDWHVDWAVLVLANTAGIIVFGPFVRAWVERTSLGVALLPERIALVAVAITVSLVVDSGVLGSTGPTAYIVVSVVVWAALRAGRMGMSTVVVISALIAAEFTGERRGPFAVEGAVETAVSLNTFLVVLGLTGLILVGLEEERRRTEISSREAADRHSAVIEGLPLVTYLRSLVDPDSPPLFLSRQTEELLGYPLERWMAEPHFASTLVHPDDRELNAELNARSLTEDSVRGEYRMIRADGRTVWVLDHMTVLRNAEGEPVAQQGFVVDISERKALEEQLGQASRLEALGLLAGGIAHDFNNLLTAISGYSGLALEHGGRENELLRRDLREVRTATARAAGLTRQLLAFGRRQVLARTVVDLNDVVLEAQSLLRRVIGEKVTVVTKLEPDLVSVSADAGQLGQVLVNLALNARDAMKEGGILTIGTSNDAGNAILTVSDTGHGMDELTRKRIFEPFFSTKPLGEGTGLGLAMVHGIIQQTGGEISVESSPGGGATFRIVLRGTLEKPAEVVEEPEVSPRGSEVVLLVEDEGIVRRLVAEMLKGQGYRVVVAAGPHEALEVTEPFDLLLTDILMPGMSGPELAALLVDRHPGVGVLFISGYSGAAVADSGGLMAELLEKPFTIEQLSQKVRAALDERLAPVI